MGLFGGEWISRKLAAKTPEWILKETIEPGLGLTPFQGAQSGLCMGVAGGQRRRRRAAMWALAKSV